MKPNINIIKKYLSNKGIKHRDCGTFISIDESIEELKVIQNSLEAQFPDRKFEINDLSDDAFIVIDKK